MDEFITLLKDYISDDYEQKRKIRYLSYLYKELSTENNKDLLLDFTESLLALSKKEKTKDDKTYKIDDEILDSFYQYLLNTNIKPSTAYDYVMRLKKIFIEFDVTTTDTTIYKGIIQNIIYEYTKGNKKEENKAKHYSPTSALGKYIEYLNSIYELICEDVVIDNTYKVPVNLYLEYRKGYSSFTPRDMHVVGYVINNRRCTIIYSDNKSRSKIVHKEISKDDFNTIASAFLNFNHILNKSTKSYIQEFVFGGGGGFCYKFNNKSNYNYVARIFESNDKEQEDFANRIVLEKINKIVYNE